MLGRSGFFIKILKNVSCEYDRWVVETQLCKLRGTSDTLIGRACAMLQLKYGVRELHIYDVMVFVKLCAHTSAVTSTDRGVETHRLDVRVCWGACFYCFFFRVCVWVLCLGLIWFCLALAFACVRACVFASVI